MFDQQKMFQELFNMSKNYWFNSLDMMTMFQEQNEKMWHTLLDQGLVTQQEGKKTVQEWLTRAKQARENFREATEDNLKKAETVFGGTPKTGKQH